jgi:hypothetical protein
MTDLDMKVRTMEQFPDCLSTDIVFLTSKIRRGVRDCRLTEIFLGDFPGDVRPREGSTVYSEILSYIRGKEVD